MIAQNTQISTKCATFSLIDDCIVFIKLHEDVEIDLEESKIMLETSKKLIHDNKYLTLIDARTKVTVTKESREWGATEEAQKNLVAQAFVVNSVANKLVGNFIIQFHKPKARTRLFSDLESALKWLKEQKK